MGHAMHKIGQGLNQVEGIFNLGPDAQNKKQLQKAENQFRQNIAQQQAIFAPPPPPPPTLADAQLKANTAADAAALAQRKRAAAGTGYAGTILTAPGAPPPQAGQRKTLLGL